MNSKLRWMISIVLTTVGCVASLWLLDASSPPGRATTKLVRSAKNTAAPSRTGTYVAGNFTFSAPVEMIRPLSPIFFQQGGEPEIKIDIFGNIYMTAIQGVPGGVDLFKSIDNGATFVYLGQPDGAQDHCMTVPQCAGLGGGDDQIDVSTGGYLYVSSLWLGNVTMSTSYDGGTGGVVPGQHWEVHPAAAELPSDDRQWVAAYGPQTINMSYATTALTRPPGSVGLFFTKSTDGGKTFSAPVEITALQPLDTVNVEGNLAVDPYNGNLYTTYIPNASPNVIKFAKSTDGGATWAITDAYTGPPGTSNRGVFPIIAVDKGGNVHLVFTRVAADRHCHVYLTSTTNPGDTIPVWNTAVQVDSGTDNTITAVQPWAVAGSPGVVDVTWLGSPAANPDIVSDWHVFFAQTTNALSSNPIFAENGAETAVMHDHSICFNGGGCAGSGNPGTEPENRDLAEYYTMTLDPEGNANIAYADTVNGCPADTCVSNAWFTKQTGGPGAYTPPAPPAAATFTPNLAIPSSGDTNEPNSWVDSHNCIFGGAIGGPIVTRSQNAGMSFSTQTVALGTGLNGGDFDIITIPQASGARPDQIYTADLGVTTVHIGKSTDGGMTYFQPGPGGSAGEVSVSSDRMWLYPDRDAPAAGDQTIYLMDHEFTSEAIRFTALTNDTAWSPFTSGMTDPELLMTTNANTNPGPVFVNHTTHAVYGLFGASTNAQNALNPPFGKILNVWEAFGPAPTVAGAPPGPFTNVRVHKGLVDSPTNPPPPAGTQTFGTTVASIFPAGDIDRSGNVYAVWAMNSSRTNEFSIWMAASHDGGQNFYGPWRVSQGTGTCVFPWVAAGDAGRIDIVWYQSSTVGDPNTVPDSATWNLMFGQSLNATAREPVFTVSQASDHVIHTGTICTSGLTGCPPVGTADRSLGDFFEVAAGPDGLANIMFADNGASGLHISYARQTAGPSIKTSPIFTTCLQTASILPVSVVSRKTHGNAGAFDVNLPLTGSHGIECRTGGASGDHQVLVSFANAVTVGNASVTSGTGMVSSFSVNGAVVTVNLTGVANAQTITITLTNVSDGTNTGDVGIPMGILLGDTTANASVNSSDISQTKGQSGAAVVDSNFREDVTVNGEINSSDISVVKAQSGTAIP